MLNAAFGAHDTAADVGSWLEWSILSARWFPAMRQFPYGDRAVTLRGGGEAGGDLMIGVAGFVPLAMPFDQIPELARQPGSPAGTVSAEVGLFWAIDPPWQGRGYATEAGRALIEYAFRELRLWRILATTQDDNRASQAVMRKVGMTLTRNPRPDPAWMQVVGVRNATASAWDAPNQPPG